MSWIKYLKLVCSGCSVGFGMRENGTGEGYDPLKNAAKKAGWYVGKGGEFCPRCAEARKAVRS